MNISAPARSAGVLAALTVINGVAQRTWLPADLVVPVGVLALVAGARASGLRADEMGLGIEAASRGLAAAGLAAAMTVAGVAAATGLPGADGLRVDERYSSPTTARRAAFTRIPLAVAIPEELAFRGVLDAALRRHLTSSSASAWGAVAFGAWHALGATTLTRDNAGLGRAVGPGPLSAAVGVAGAVVATAVAGLGFLALRRRSDSVLSGIAVHWALNATAALAAGLRRPPRADACRPARAGIQ
ncbi:MAG: type II CAAX prenyl endopeptidase Rce1 family protein [Dermatophilaceae bacterium]|nr:CPBP family intramembrane metalloprotease [Intrasporangiaceae bacterium]